jgi:hypothetical protein
VNHTAPGPQLCRLGRGAVRPVALSFLMSRITWREDAPSGCPWCVQRQACVVRAGKSPGGGRIRMVGLQYAAQQAVEISHEPRIKTLGLF